MVALDQTLKFLIKEFMLLLFYGIVGLFDCFLIPFHVNCYYYYFYYFFPLCLSLFSLLPTTSPPTTPSGVHPFSYDSTLDKTDYCWFYYYYYYYNCWTA